MRRFENSKTTAILLIIVFILSNFPLHAHAQGGMVILNPTDDAYLDEIDTNYGSEPVLKVSLSYLSWLKFDISTVPEGAFGIKATLELYTTYMGVPEPRNVIACLNLNNTWSEDTITMGNAPWSGGEELDSDYVASDETWYEWDITEAVVNATANNTTAVTIELRHPWGLMVPHMSFNSKEALKKIPKLTVSWTDVIPEFPSVIILPLFMTATLIATIVQRRKRKAKPILRHTS